MVLNLPIYLNRSCLTYNEAVLSLTTYTWLDHEQLPPTIRIYAIRRKERIYVCDGTNLTMAYGDWPTRLTSPIEGTTGPYLMLTKAGAVSWSLAYAFTP